MGGTKDEGDYPWVKPDSKTWFLTPSLRWALPRATTTKSDILQQAWRCQETGEVNWVDVPRETLEIVDE